MSKYTPHFQSALGTAAIHYTLYSIHYTEYKHLKHYTLYSVL